MSLLIFQFERFGIELTNVQVKWDAGIRDFKMEVYKVTHHEWKFLESLCKGLPNLIGTNDPSCAYAFDIIVDEPMPDGSCERIVFPKFQWHKMEYALETFYMEGYYGRTDT